MPESPESRPLSPWKQQPESRQGPDTFGAPGRVSGVLVCSEHVHALTRWSEEHRHESDEERTERAEHHRKQCRRCLGITEATGLGRERGNATDGTSGNPRARL